MIHRCESIAGQGAVYCLSNSSFGKHLILRGENYFYRYREHIYPLDKSSSSLIMDGIKQEAYRLNCIVHNTKFEKFFEVGEEQKFLDSFCGDVALISPYLIFKQKEDYATFVLKYS